MRRAAASVWTVIAVGNLLNAAEPGATAEPNPAVRASTSTSAHFVDIAPTAGLAEANSASRERARSPYDQLTRGATDGPNWLLDAMSRETGATPATFEGLIREAREGAPRNRSARSVPERQPATSAPNPFADFLASWMTRDDYALLKLQGETNAPQLQAERERGGSVSAPRIRTRGTASENPFIAAQQAAQEQIEENPSDTSSTTSRPMILQATPITPTTPAAQATARADWQPATNNDKKYFPQLNRF